MPQCPICQAWPPARPSGVLVPHSMYRRCVIERGDVCRGSDKSPYTNNLELVNPKSDAHPKGSSTGGLSSPSQAVQSAESNDHLA